MSASTAPTSPRSVELLALDSTLLNRLVAGSQGDPAGDHRRYREWTARVGKQQHRARSSGTDGTRRRRDQLLDAVAGRAGRPPAGRRELLLGVKPGLDAFATATELGVLDKVPQRGIQLLKRTPSRLGGESQTATLLDAITDIARGVIQRLRALPRCVPSPAEIRLGYWSVAASTDPAAREQADRTAGGLLRVALDRLSEHETADDEVEFVRRRHRRLAAGAKAAGSWKQPGPRDDELVSVDPVTVIALGPRPACLATGRWPITHRSRRASAS